MSTARKKSRNRPFSETTSRPCKFKDQDVPCSDCGTAVHQFFISTLTEQSSHPFQRTRGCLGGPEFHSWQRWSARKPESMSKPGRWRSPNAPIRPDARVCSPAFRRTGRRVLLKEGLRTLDGGVSERNVTDQAGSGFPEQCHRSRHRTARLFPSRRVNPLEKSNDQPRSHITG